jgi:beta-mannosidase
VDYFLRPKPAYFAIARELRPYTVGITRKEKKTYADERTAAFFTIDTLIEIWGTNKTLEDKKVKLDVAAYDLDDPSWHDGTTEDVILKANSSTELFEGNLPGQKRRTGLSENAKPIIVSARLIGDNGEVLGRYANWWVSKARTIRLYLLLTLVGGLNLTSSSSSHLRRTLASKQLSLRMANL